MSIELLKVSPSMAASLAVSGEKLARMIHPTARIECPTVKTRVNETFRKVDAALSWMDEAEANCFANA
jgi:hypothetical protein